MKIPTINCVFFTEYAKCTHLDRGRGFLWLGKVCILLSDKFVAKCSKRVLHARPTGPPPPPIKSQKTNA